MIRLLRRTLPDSSMTVRIALALFLLINGWLVLPASLLATQPGKCAMSCCSTSAECCCAPRKLAALRDPVGTSRTLGPERLDESCPCPITSSASVRPTERHTGQVVRCLPPELARMVSPADGQSGPESAQLLSCSGSRGPPS